MDHLLEGRFIFGISPGALESDAEALGIRGIDRNEMFAESIGHILDIWQGEPPYNLEGKHWKISTEETLMPEIGLGPIAKPYQKPHPPIICTVVAPFSKGVIEMGKKGFLPISANFLLDKWVKTHWANYAQGCEEGGREAKADDWRVALRRHFDLPESFASEVAGVWRESQQSTDDAGFELPPEAFARIFVERHLAELL